MKEYISVIQNREMINNSELEKGMILHIDNARFVVLDPLCIDGEIVAFGLKQDKFSGLYKHECIHLSDSEKSQLLGLAKSIDINVYI